MIKESCQELERIGYYRIWTRDGIGGHPEAHAVNGFIPDIRAKNRAGDVVLLVAEDAESIDTDVNRLSIFSD